MHGMKKKLGNPEKDCGLNLGTFAARLLRTASTYPRTSWDIHLSSSSGFTGFLSVVSWKDNMYMNGKYFYKNEEQMPHNSSFCCSGRLPKVLVTSYSQMGK